MNFQIGYPLETTGTEAPLVVHQKIKWEDHPQNQIGDRMKTYKSTSLPNFIVSFSLPYRLVIVFYALCW